jgi:hypothetical protein
LGAACPFGRGKKLLFRHCEEGVSPTRQSSKFNGFDWIASLLAVQAPRNDEISYMDFNNK